MTKIRKVKVADYLTNQINISGKSQKEIAEEVGYPMPNVITMFKQGKTKLPINKVALFAKSLGIDPVHLLRLTMTEYTPETWEVIEELLGDNVLSQDERRVIEALRKVGLGFNATPQTPEELREFGELVLKWRKREIEHADAARRRVVRDKTGKEDEAEKIVLEENLDILLGFVKPSEEIAA